MIAKQLFEFMSALYCNMNMLHKAKVFDIRTSIQLIAAELMCQLVVFLGLVNN